MACTTMSTTTPTQGSGSIIKGLVSFCSLGGPFVAYAQYDAHLRQFRAVGQVCRGGAARGKEGIPVSC